MNTYSRGNIFGSLPQVTKLVLIFNIAFFVLNYFTMMMPSLSRYNNYGGAINFFLSLKSFSTGAFKPFQLITHMFLHGGLGHIFFNMFGLYMFGRILESVLGSKKFFILYFASGLGAAILQLLVYYMQGTPGLMIGASGAIFGILAAFAMMFPNVELMFIFIPVPIKAKYLVPIYAVLELFFGIANFSKDNIAHFAHLGGAIVGFILIKIWKKNQFKIF